MILLMLAHIAAAATPPFIPSDRMPPAIHPLGPAVSAPAARALPPAPPLTAERINALPVSGILQGVLLRNIGALPTSTNDTGTFSSKTGSSRDRFIPVADATAQQPALNATADALIDVEPTTISINIGGTMHTTTVAAKYVNGGYNAPVNFYAHTTNFSTYDRGPLALPVGYEWSGDPVLAINPYTGGIAPKRMYCAALLFNPAGANAQSAIGVWRSDNGGQTWQGPTIVASHGGGGYLVDKPWIAVSWHSSSLGNVYVGWMNIDTDQTRNPGGLSNSLWVARSLNGGLSFQDTNVLAYDNVQGPQLVVNTATGAVTCVWLNIGANDIRAASSTNYGISFGAHEIVSAGGNLLTTNPWSSGLRAVSLPMARYNWIAGRTMVVYHGTGNALDIFYTYKPCSSSCTASGWRQPIAIHSNTTRDQLMPGLDFDLTGRVLITYYDFRGSATQYHEFFSYLTADGTRVHDDVQMSVTASIPANLPNFGLAGRHFIGDYQEVWEDSYPEGERATAGWISITSNYTDVLFTRIVY